METGNPPSTLAGSSPDAARIDLGAAEAHAFDAATAADAEPIAPPEPVGPPVVPLDEFKEQWALLWNALASFSHPAVGVDYAKPGDVTGTEATYRLACKSKWLYFLVDPKTSFIKDAIGAAMFTLPRAMILRAVIPAKLKALRGARPAPIGAQPGGGAPAPAQPEGGRDDRAAPPAGDGLGWVDEEGPTQRRDTGLLQ